MEFLRPVRQVGWVGRVFFLALPLFASAVPAHAHDQWIDVSDFSPALGDTVHVYVCGGHYFPESAFAVKDNVLEGVWARGTEGEPSAIHTHVEEKRRVGVLAVDAGGVWLLAMSLKRPKAKEPSFEAKTLIFVDLEADDPDRYLLGEGLELVPRRPVSAVGVGEDLPVSLMMDGKSISGSLTVVPAAGNTFYVKTDAGRPAAVRIRRAGKYLVAAEVGGRGCSLVFEVMEAEGREEE